MVLLRKLVSTGFDPFGDRMESMKCRGFIAEMNKALEARMAAAMQLPLYTEVKPHHLRARIELLAFTPELQGRLKLCDNDMDLLRKSQKQLFWPFHKRADSDSPWQYERQCSGTATARLPTILRPKSAYIWL